MRITIRSQFTLVSFLDRSIQHYKNLVNDYKIPKTTAEIEQIIVDILLNYKEVHSEIGIISSAINQYKILSHEDSDDRELSINAAKEYDSVVVNAVLLNILSKNVIKILNFCNVEINLPKLTKLQETLNHKKTINSLTALNLSDNTITDEGIEVLINILKSNPSINIFDISSNIITNKGVKELAEYLKGDYNLKTLIISDNYIKDASYLLNNNLVNIFACCNDISNLTAEVMSLPNAKLLNFNGNDIYSVDPHIIIYCNLNKIHLELNRYSSDIKINNDNESNYTDLAQFSSLNPYWSLSGDDVSRISSSEISHEIQDHCYTSDFN